MPGTLLYRSILVITILSVAVSIAACEDPKTNTNTATSTNQAAPTSPAPPKVGFEADLEYVRKGQYTYIWVFSRKDGKPLDKNDSDYLRKNAPQVVDWVTTDNGNRVIAGTNFDLALGNLDLLKKRFNAEDYTGR